MNGNEIAYVLTRQVNDYNQDGEYFVAVFRHCPTVEKIMNIMRGMDQYSGLDNEVLNNIALSILDDRHDGLYTDMRECFTLNQVKYGELYHSN